MNFLWIGLGLGLIFPTALLRKNSAKQCCQYCHVFFYGLSSKGFLWSFAINKHKLHSHSLFHIKNTLYASLRTRVECIVLPHKMFARPILFFKIFSQGIVYIHVGLVKVFFFTAFHFLLLCCHQLLISGTNSSMLIMSSACRTGSLQSAYRLF